MTTRRPSPAVVRVLAKLTGLGRRIEEQGRGWRAQCPAHDDEHPSLAVNSAEDDGKALLKCWAGCLQDEVITALGLDLKALFLTREELRIWQGGGGAPPASGPNTSTAATPSRPTQDLGASRGGVHTPDEDAGQGQGKQATADSRDEPEGLTLDAYADAKQLPKPYLQQLNLSTVYVHGTPVVSIPYKDETNRTVAVQFRRALRRGQHEDGRFTWSRKGTTPILYGLWRLPEMRQSPWIVVVEGASDCHTLWHYDIPALGLPGANSWREAWAPALDGFETVYILREPDRGGQAVENWLATSSIRSRVKLMSLEFLSSPAAPIKDPSDLHVRRAWEFRDCWEEALGRAVPWAEVHRQQMRQQVSTLYRDIKDLLARVKKTLLAMGYVGDTAPPTLMYLVMTSRLLPRPMNGACVGPSSAGKNETVNAAKAHMPPEDVYEINAASPMALVYSDASFERKIVIFSEMDSIPEDGPAGSAIRSLAATNELAYDVVEKSPKTGRFETRRIRKPGPTVLITTGTRSPGPQLGTRMLEIPVSDAPQQTWAILARQALQASGQAPAAPDLRRWIDLQRWLALQPARVHIPFAAQLLAAIKARLTTPPIRLRRDFTQLQTCIAAIALLYQCQRHRAPDGAVLATLDDYEEARVLLEPIFASISTEGVTKAVRETVEKVPPGEEVSESELARRLGLSKTATHERVRRAVTGGWLVNHEDRKGYAAKLVRGTPLPEDRPVLPTKADLLADSLAGATHNTEADLEAPPQPQGSDEPLGNGPTITTTDGTVCQAPTPASAGEHPTGEGANDVTAMQNSSRSTVLVEQDASVPPLPSPPDSPLPMSAHDGHERREGAPPASATAEPVGMTRAAALRPSAPSAVPSVAQTATPRTPVPTKKVAAPTKRATTSTKKAVAPVVDVGPTFDPGRYLYIRDAAALETVLPQLVAAPALGFDIETTGLSHVRNRPRLVQLATPQQTVIVDLDHVPLALLAPVMQGDRVLYGDNLKFELKFLTQAGLPYPTCRLFDTMLAAILVEASDVDPKKGRFTLEAIAKRYLQVSLDKRWQKGPWEGTLCEEQLRYAASDAALMFPLVATLQGELASAGLEPIMALEMACLPALVWIERAGMGVDADAWMDLARRVQERTPQLEAELADLTRDYVKAQRDGKPINWDSRPQVLAVLRARGIPAANTRRETLQPFSHDPVVARFLERSPLAKRASTFGAGWVADYFHPETGRVYPDFQQIGSRAGRMSCREPNLQQIPKGIAYRHCFRAPEGSCLVGGDYSQIELRILAYVSQEPALLEAFQRGIDPHRQTAAKVFKVPYEAVTADQRAKAKAINFGVIYGLGHKRLAAAIGYSEGEAKAFVDAYSATYTKVNRYRQAQLRLAQKTGAVRTILGRRRLMTRIHQWDDPQHYQVRNMTLNTPIQGSAADGFKRALVRLFQHRDEVPGVRIVNLVHDEIVTECPREQVADTKAWLARHMIPAMRDMMAGGVAIEVDLRDGQSWAG